MKLTKKITKRFEVPGDEDGAWVIIRFLKANEVRRIESQANDMFFESDAKGEGSTRINFDPYTRSKLFAHAAVESWGGMFSTTGKPLKLNAVNMDKAAEFTMLVNGDKVDFFAWIDQCREELSVEVEGETEKAEEN